MAPAPKFFWDRGGARQGKAGHKIGVSSFFIFLLRKKRSRRLPPSSGSALVQPSPVQSSPSSSLALVCLYFYPILSYPILSYPILSYHFTHRSYSENVSLCGCWGELAGWAGSSCPTQFQVQLPLSFLFIFAVHWYLLGSAGIGSVRQAVYAYLLTYLLT